MLMHKGYQGSHFDYLDHSSVKLDVNNSTKIYIRSEIIQIHNKIQITLMFSLFDYLSWIRSSFPKFNIVSFL